MQSKGRLTHPSESGQAWGASWMPNSGDAQKVIHRGRGDGKSAPLPVYFALYNSSSSCSSLAFLISFIQKQQK
jgi:hypothetical protein